MKNLLERCGKQDNHVFVLRLSLRIEILQLEAESALKRT